MLTVTGTGRKQVQTPSIRSSQHAVVLAPLNDMWIPWPLGVTWETVTTETCSYEKRSLDSKRQKVSLRTPPGEKDVLIPQTPFFHLQIEAMQLTHSMKDVNYTVINSTVCPYPQASASKEML